MLLLQLNKLPENRRKLQNPDGLALSSLRRLAPQLVVGSMSVSSLTVNGLLFECPEPVRLDIFLSLQGLNAKSVVVELNGEAVIHSAFTSVHVKAGDALEIVKIVAGG